MEKGKGNIEASDLKEPKGRAKRKEEREGSDILFPSLPLFFLVLFHLFAVDVSSSILYSSSILVSSVRKKRERRTEREEGEERKR